MIEEIIKLLEKAVAEHNKTRFDNVAELNHLRGKIYAFTQVINLIQKEENQNDNSQYY